MQTNKIFLFVNFQFRYLCKILILGMLHDSIANGSRFFFQPLPKWFVQCCVTFGMRWHHSSVMLRQAIQAEPILSTKGRLLQIVPSRHALNISLLPLVACPLTFSSFFNWAIFSLLTSDARNQRAATMTCWSELILPSTVSSKNIKVLSQSFWL